MRRPVAVLTLVAALASGQAARAGIRAHYGGTLRAILPGAPQAFDPALAANAADLIVARLVHATLVSLSPEGTLQAELLAAVPESEAQGRLFRLRLRPGARFQDGSTVGASDVIGSLSRLLDPALGSPVAVLALPLVGAQEPSRAVSGLAATGEFELQASLAFAYPDWMRGLAHPSAAVMPARPGPMSRPLGAGPFAWARTGEVSFVAFPDCALGRPFADALRISTGDARNAARALALGEADLSAVPGAERPGALGPALFTSYLALNPSRLGARAALVRQAVETSVDVAGLTRTFVRAPAQPLLGLLPPLLDAASAASRTERAERASLSSGTHLVLISDASDDDHRAVGERLQVKLHDAGVILQIRRLARAELRAALARGEYDLALVSFAAIPEPGMALAQLVLFGLGRDAAREELRVIGAGADLAARRAIASTRARELRDRLPLIPLYVQALRIVSRPGVAVGGFDASGVPGLADAWFEAGRGTAPASP